MKAQNTPSTTNPANELPPLVTRAQLARRWQTSGETLKRREAAGILPCLKLGHAVRYRREDVERIEAAAVVTR